MFDTLGCPLADKKRTLMADEGDFLGVVHNLKVVAVSGVTTCTPRAALLKKATEMLKGFLKENKCTPAQASKFRGLQGFLNLSLFGQLSKGGARAFKDWQYRDRLPWTLSGTMRRAIDFYLAIFSDCPSRSIQLRMARRPPLIVASDAQVEPDVYPGGGCLIYDPESHNRFGAWCEFRERELAMLEISMEAIANGGQPIAKCELAMLPILLYQESKHFVGRDIILLVDNTAALGGIVKGASGLAVSELLIASFWMKAFALQVRL